MTKTQLKTEQHLESAVLGSLAALQPTAKQGMKQGYFAKARLGLGLTMLRKSKSWVGLSTMGLSTKRWVGLSTIALIANLAGVSSSALAAVLTDVKFASMSGDRTEVTLTFDEAPPQPSGYTIAQPARIAVDLKGVTNGLKSRNMSLGVGNAQSLTVVEAKDRTRLIFNLVQLVPYSADVRGNQIVLQIGSEASAGSVASAALNQGAATSSTTTAAPSTADQLTNVDFHRGEKGEGQVVISLSNSKIGVDMTEEGGKIRLRIAGAGLPENLRRRLDVTDFATPVKRVDTFMEDGVVIVEIRPEGNYDFLAYQADNQFTVSVEPLTEDQVEKRRKDKFPYSGEKLSLNFQNIEVRSVLQLIADFTGLNLVASDTVSGSITLRLQNVPWDQALELILKTKGLDKRQVGNVLLVAPADEIAAREKLELETNKQIAELAPLRLDIVQVNYAKAKDIVDLLKKDDQLISERGFISSDERTNSISVRETADKLEQIRRLVSTWDIPVRQVLIEARIVRARADAAEELGIEWGGAGSHRVNEGKGAFLVGGSSTSIKEVGNNAFAASDGNAATDAITLIPDALAVDLGVTRANTSSIAIGYQRNDMILDLALSAFQSDGKAEIVAQPRIVTADRKSAKIKSGEEIPFQEATSSGATNVEFKEAVLSLEVTPQITPDDKIIMDLKVNQDNRGQVTNGVPSIETNEVTTQVLVANGETIVLGGIFQSEVSSTVTKTPFLGDIPYLGRLFKKTESVDTRSELLVFITPKIMKGNLTE